MAARNTTTVREYEELKINIQSIWSATDFQLILRLQINQIRR